MKLSLLLLGAVTTTMAASAYCIEHSNMVLDGKITGAGCGSKSTTKCNLDEAVKACNKKDKCMGVTCFQVDDSKIKKCVLRSGSELIPSDGENDASWLKGDSECDTTENRVPTGVVKKKKKDEDDFGFADMMMLQSLNGGDPLDPTLAMVMGADMKDMMMMGMMEGGDLLSGVAGEMDPTMMAMMMGDGDMADMMLMSSLMNNEEPSASTPTTINGINCPAGTVARSIKTTTGTRVICSSALATGEVASGVRCMYGTRLITTTTGETKTVCASRVISTTTATASNTGGTKKGGNKNLKLKRQLKRARRAKRAAEQAAMTAGVNP